MKNTTTSLPKININSLLILSCIVGISAGVIISFSVDDSTLSQVCTASRLIALAEKGKWFSLFVKHFAVNLIWLLLSMTLGFSPIYQFGSFLLIMLKGAEIGVLSRGIYLTSDVLQSLTVYLPFAVIGIIILIAQSRSAVELSNMYMAITLTNENRIGLKNEAGEYMAKFCVFALLTAIVCALRCLVICLLAR